MSMDDDLKEEIQKGAKLEKPEDEDLAAREEEKRKRQEELEALKQAMMDSGQWEEPPADEECTCGRTTCR